MLGQLQKTMIFTKLSHEKFSHTRATDEGTQPNLRNVFGFY